MLPAIGEVGLAYEILKILLNKQGAIVFVQFYLVGWRIFQEEIQGRYFLLVAGDLLVVFSCYVLVHYRAGHRRTLINHRYLRLLLDLRQILQLSRLIHQCPLRTLHLNRTIPRTNHITLYKHVLVLLNLFALFLFDFIQMQPLLDPCDWFVIQS